MQSVYYTRVANRREYDMAYECLKNRGKSFPVSDPRQASLLVEHVIKEHSEFFYVTPQVPVAVGPRGAQVTPQYLYSPRETAELDRKLRAEASAIIAEVINDHQSDFDKVCALHDYLKSHIEYDFAMASINRVTDRQVAEAHTIVGALLKHKCVCDGFALAMKYLCDMISLECWVVIGEGHSSRVSGPHAWNIVKINGYYHHVDVTWDNQLAGDRLMPNYGYLNLSDDEIGIDHIWERSHYPACPSSPYNYFKVNDALMSTRVQLENFLYNSIQNEDEWVMFRVVSGTPLASEIDDCLASCVQNASNRSRYSKLKEYKCSYNQEQLTYSLTFRYA